MRNETIDSRDKNQEELNRVKTKCFLRKNAAGMTEIIARQFIAGVKDQK